AAISGANSSSRPKRRGLATAAAALIALLVCGVAGGLYLADPSLFGSAHESQNASPAVPVANTSNTTVNANLETATVNTNTQVPLIANAEPPTTSAGST